MIERQKNITQYFSQIFGFALLFLLVGCGNSKEVAEEPSIFNQRKLFKSVFHQANSEKMIGHYEKAIVLFEECLKMEPNNPAVHFALADLYEEQGDKAKTLNFAERAYALQNENKWYALRLADLYFERNEFSKTADLYAGIIDEEKNIDLKFKYTDALIKAKRFDEAVKMLNEIEVETGKIPEVSFTKYDLLVELGQTEAAEKELADLINENPTDSDYKIMVAEFYMQEGKFEQSEELIGDILTKDPDYGQAYIMMADLKLRQDDVKGAFSNLEKGFASDEVEIDRKLEILRGLVPYSQSGQRDFAEMRSGTENLFQIIYNPDLKNHKLHDYYGYFLVTQQNYDAAEEQYQIACDLDPSSFNSWLQLLDLELKTERFEKMAANGKKATELFPSQPIIYLLAGIGSKETKDYETAEEWFFLGKDLVVQDDQLRSEFLYQIGDMNYRQENTDEGEFYFDQAIQAFSGNINVYAARAEQKMDQGQLSEAEIEIKKGIDIAPKSPKLQDLYGQILFEQKKYKEASDAFIEALHDNYFEPTILERCGDAFFLMGEKEKGIDLWGEAIKNGNASSILKRKFAEKTYYKPE